MGICEDAPDEYCGHVLEPEDAGVNREADHRWHVSTRNAVCLREPKYGGLCVWHADTDEKTAEELIGAKLTHNDVPWEVDCVKEHLAGAILWGIRFPEEFSFAGCVLTLAEFHTVLPKVKFHGADLREADFLDADLREANFHGANLLGANFQNANLREAEFHDANLCYAEFPDAFLTGAKFPDAVLREAKFPDADLSRTEFSDANFQEAEFRDTNLQQAKFRDANLCDAEFIRANLFGAKFLDAVLPEAKFLCSNLSEAKFHDAVLPKAEFLSTDLRYARFLNTDLRNVGFPGANVSNAEFLRSDLRWVNFSEANAQEAVFSDADMRSSSLRPACASGIESEEDDIRNSFEASLEDAQFEDGTDLRGADLSGARLYQTAFRDVRINDKTKFGIKEGRYGEKCRYEYDPNTGVSTNEDVPRLRAAAWTYRRLESLFEENAMDERARNAHIRKEEARRAEYEEQMQDDWPPIRAAVQAYHGIISRITLPRFPRLRAVSGWTVSRLNWHLHRHGESLRQLLKISALFIIGCGLLYPLIGGINSANSGGPYRITSLNEFVGLEAWVDIANSLYFSAITFTTIGYGDFYPAGTGSRILVALESLGGALLIALFVFVIGRRVAR